MFATDATRESFSHHIHFLIQHSRPTVSDRTVAIGNGLSQPGGNQLAGSRTYMCRASLTASRKLAPSTRRYLGKHWLVPPAPETTAHTE